MKKLFVEAKCVTTGKVLQNHQVQINQQTHTVTVAGVAFKISDRIEDICLTDSERLAWLATRESTYLTVDDQKFLARMAKQLRP